MGICSTFKTKSLPKGQSYNQEPIMETLNTRKKFMFDRKNGEFVNWTEYDYSNPHRQYNVVVNGVLFQVINSVENSSLGIEETERYKL